MPFRGPSQTLSVAPSPVTPDKNQDTFDHDKGQNSAIWGCRLHWIFARSSVQFSKDWAALNGRD